MRQFNSLDLSMEKLRECFVRAKKQEAKYIAIQYKIEGMNGLETIITERDNFDLKLRSIENRYDNNLSHKFEDIIIVNYTFANKIRELHHELY